MTKVRWGKCKNSSTKVNKLHKKDVVLRNPLIYVKDYFCEFNFFKFVEIPAMFIGFDTIIEEVNGLA